MPPIVGALVGASCTWIENAGSATLAVPSFTEITMFEYVPTFAAAGVPLRRPVHVLKLAHDGRLEIAKRSLSPSGSLAVGGSCKPG